jgi:hypothetical protein
MGEFKVWLEEQVKSLEARTTQSLQEHFQLLGAVSVLREVLAKCNELDRPQDTGGVG